MAASASGIRAHPSPFAHACETAAVIAIRRARPADAVSIGAVHVAAWRSTYPGILPDRFLADLSIPRQAAHYDQASVQVGGQSIPQTAFVWDPIEKLFEASPLSTRRRAAFRLWITKLFLLVCNGIVAYKFSRYC